MTEKFPADKVRENASGRLKVELYVVRSWLTGALQGLREHRDAHYQYLMDLERRGQVFGNGPLFTENGTAFEGDALLILRADSLRAAEEIARIDPYHVEGVRGYEVLPWLLNEGSFAIRIDINSGDVAFT